jgi:hypothetical protein
MKSASTRLRTTKKTRKRIIVAHTNTHEDQTQMSDNERRIRLHTTTKRLPASRNYYSKLIGSRSCSWITPHREGGTSRAEKESEVRMKVTAPVKSLSLLSAISRKHAHDNEVNVSFTERRNIDADE